MKQFMKQYVEWAKVNKKAFIVTVGGAVVLVGVVVGIQQYIWNNKYNKLQDLHDQVQHSFISKREEVEDLQDKIDDLENKNENQAETILSLTGKTDGIPVYTSTEDTEDDTEDVQNTEYTEESKYTKTLTPGQYVVGEDIVPGTYDIVCINSTGNIWNNSDLNEILDSTGKYYSTNYKNAEFVDGDTITVKTMTVELREK